MISFAVKNLVSERMRLAISVGGVALAVMLIVLLRGLYVAYETKVSDRKVRMARTLNLHWGLHPHLWLYQPGPNS